MDLSGIRVGSEWEIRVCYPSVLSEWDPIRCNPATAYLLPLQASGRGARRTANGNG